MIFNQMFAGGVADTSECLRSAVMSSALLNTGSYKQAKSAFSDLYLVFFKHYKKKKSFGIYLKKKLGKKKSSNWFLVKEISCLRYFASFPTEQKKYFGEGLQLAEHTKWDVSGKKKKKKG